ncbi:hypothetical protein KAU45_09345 [bacterium]|nr:hypothetical protein [bacterium]
MKYLITIVIIFITFVTLAGGIYQARCADCGYTQDGLWHGKGIEDPFAVYAVYWAADWGRVISVEFDLSYEFGELIGFDFGPIRRSTAIWDAVNDHHGEYLEFFDAWEPPGVIEEGGFPHGARIASDRPETHLIPRMLLMEGIWQEEKSFPCPQCGKRTLVFLQIGLWD